MRRALVRPLLLLGLTPLLACGDDTPPAAEGTTGDASSSTAEPTTGDEASTSTSAPATSTGQGESSTTGEETTGGEVPEPLAWQADCVAGGYDLLRLHPELQCTAIEVPLDWDTPDGDAILVGALRIPSAVQPRLGTLWALDGGPGGSGFGFAMDPGLVSEFTEAGWDLIIPPHRGTFSPFLECDAPTESSDCAAELQETWGDGLQHFNTLEAARDVGEFIRRERASADEPTVVYGVSYGTYWGQFYANEFPDQATAIILDSTVPTSIDIATQEYTVQTLAEQLLQACVDDPTCGARVGFESGAAFSQAVIDAIDNDDCGAGDFGLWEDSNFHTTFGQLINTRGSRNYVPLLAAMLSRCDPALSTIVNESIFDLFGFGGPRDLEHFPFGTEQVPGHSRDGSPPPFDLMFSGALQFAVIATSMLRADATPEVAELDAQRHFAGLGFGSLMARTKAGWGTLPKVEFEGDVSASTPMLIFNAHYDLQTPFPWAEIVAEQHGGTLVEFADGQHALSFSGTGGKTLDGQTCARAMMLDFMADPSAAVDDSCTATLPGIDVNLQRADLAPLSMSAFGTDDPWSLLPPL